MSDIANQPTPELEAVDSPNLPDPTKKSFLDKAREFLGLKDNPDTDITDRKERRINRAVAKAVERDLRDNVSLGERADDVIDRVASEGEKKPVGLDGKKAPKRKDTEELATKIFTGEEGADALSEKEKAKIVDRAVEAALEKLKAGTYATEVDYRTAVRDALSHVDIDYQYSQQKDEMRKRMDGESKEDYQKYKAAYREYEEAFKKWPKAERVESVHIVADINELGTNKKFERDGDQKTKGNGEPKEEAPNYHQANESILEQRGFKVAATAMQAIVGTAASPVAAAALILATKGARKAGELGGDNYAHGDEVEFTKIKAAMEGVKEGVEGLGYKGKAKTKLPKIPGVE